MKRVMLTLTGLLLINLVSVEAQSRDTIPQKRPSSQRIGQGSTSIDEKRKIAATDIPSSVRQTLQGPEYKGWDNQTTKLYRNKVGNRYTVEFHNGNKIKVYQFDSDGNRIDYE